MNVPPSAMDESALGVLAVLVALLLVGGSVVLRWQRNRQQFLLMQTALKEGLQRFPAGPPFWLLSLRQGVMTLTIGVGLLGVGTAAWMLAQGVEPPTQAQLQAGGGPGGQGQGGQVQIPGQPRAEGERQPPRPEQRPPEQRPPDQRPPDQRAMDPLHLGPLPPGQRPPRPEALQQDPQQQQQQQQRPPVANIAIERWHRAEAQKTVGLIAMGCGVILMFLGIVQIGFATVEQRYSRIGEPPSGNL